MLRRLTPIVVAAAVAFAAPLVAQDAPPEEGKKDEAAPKAPEKPKGEDAPKKDDAQPEVVKAETTAPVIALSIRTKEKETDQPCPNLAQYVCFEALGKIGMVVETRLPPEFAKPYDKWIVKAAEKLVTKKPAGPFKVELPPPAFVVDATITLVYRPNKFYDKAILDIFEAQVDGQITDGTGKQLKPISFKRYFGETPQVAKPKIRDKSEMLAASVILSELFGTPGFSDKVPADKKAEFEKNQAFVNAEAQKNKDVPK